MSVPRSVTYGLPHRDRRRGHVGGRQAIDECTASRSSVFRRPSTTIFPQPTTRSGLTPRPRTSPRMRWTGFAPRATRTGDAWWPRSWVDTSACIPCTRAWPLARTPILIPGAKDVNGPDHRMGDIGLAIADARPGGRRRRFLLDTMDDAHSETWARRIRSPSPRRHRRRTRAGDRVPHRPRNAVDDARSHPARWHPHRLRPRARDSLRYGGCRLGGAQPVGPHGVTEWHLDHARRL